MAILRIRTYPDPILREETQLVTEFNDDLRRLTENMAETMWDAPGVGLAAPQIGESLKLIVVDVSQDREEAKEYMVLANPVIIDHEGIQEDEEGCLSLPDLTSKVDRYKAITVRYQDLTGQTNELKTEDRFAVVLQHEIDHLNGVLFLDHLSHLKRTLYKKKVKKWLKE